MFLLAFLPHFARFLFLGKLGVELAESSPRKNREVAAPSLCAELQPRRAACLLLHNGAEHDPALLSSRGHVSWAIRMQKPAQILLVFWLRILES